jgi:hypothetical protein
MDIGRHSTLPECEIGRFGLLMYIVPLSMLLCVHYLCYGIYVPLALFTSHGIFVDLQLLSKGALLRATANVFAVCLVIPLLFWMLWPELHHVFGLVA